ncbi:DUF3992 domain-containing protein [Priestia megaterium]|uniref:S-Ena type endospore appendage n=1 Tax=Priestia megaterium TaxID=1404 RepID=UPI0022813FB8|nr:S-Ena type endospore appendage [Priestia megaterium]MCY9026074.1 DUF3992 domain-containing protein [Priestia megaterium]
MKARKLRSFPSSHENHCHKRERDNCKSHYSKSKISKIICNEICGNLLLSDGIPILEIWKKIIEENTLLTISVFNNDMSTSSIRVLMNGNEESPVEFTVPPGNTLSATVDHIESVRVIQVGNGLIRGKFCLKVCFPVFCDSKRNYKKDSNTHYDC